MRDNLFKSLNKKKHTTPFRIITVGFILAILVGTVLLMLPVSHSGVKPTGFSDALFTATSAICVTGLVVQDTATYWSAFGQLVILVMIQIGGMGVVTAATSVAIISGRKISLLQRKTIQDTVAAPTIGGVVRLTRFIIKTTILIELIGASIMVPVFCRDFGAAKGVWMAIFHSISAFCNAGFDLMGEGPKGKFSSLTFYETNPVINITVMALIIIGGIGFLTWEDVRSNGLRLKKYRMQSKVILSVTSVLVIIPVIYFYFWELTQVGEGERGAMSMGERLISCAFQSVTTRTAGFNTVNLTDISEAGLMIIMVLMLIGGSPGSTAGGIKTTTLAVLIKSAESVFKRKENAEIFGRRISDETVKYASTTMIMYAALFVLGAIAISLNENLPMLVCLFETASAIGTVGLSLGITPFLGQFSRGILIILMFMGRVGGLTLIFAAVSGNIQNAAKLPEGKITVG